MSNIITFNGSSYTIPDVGEVDWGQNVTDFLVAIPNGALQPTGGLFSLSAEVDFGSNFGLKSIYYKSRTANIASTGIVRLARTDGVVWRNQANLADLILGVDASDNLTFNGVILESDVLPSANIFVGNGSNESTPVAMTGDISINNAGLTAIVGGVIVNADVNASAAIAVSKLAALSPINSIVRADGSGIIDGTLWGLTSSIMTTPSQAEIRFVDSGANYVSFAAPASVTTYPVLWPGAQGAAGEIMINDGAGTLAWGVSTGMGTVNSGVSGRLAYYSATGTVVDDTSAITTDGSTWARFADGTIALPSISFNSDVDSGLYLVSANQPALVAGGSAGAQLELSTSNLELRIATVIKWAFNANQCLSPDGTEGAPAISFAVDTDTGIYRSTTNVMQLVAAGEARVQIDGNFSVKNDAGSGVFQVVPASDYVTMVGSTLRLTDGLVGTPAVTFASDLNTGMYKLATDQIGFSCGGNFAGGFALSGGVATLNLPDGTLARPAVSFNSDGNLGIYRSANDTMNMVAAGSDLAAWTNAGVAMKAGKRIFMDDGTNLLPGLVNSADFDTGFYFDGSGRPSFTHSGSQVFYASTGGVRSIAIHLFQDGTEADPSITFISDTDTGLWRSGSGVVQIVNNGEARVQVDGNFSVKNNAGAGVFQVVPASDYVNMASSTLRNTAGAVGTPSVTFGADLDLGIYRVSEDNLGITAGGMLAVQIQDPADLSAGQTSLQIYDDDNGTIERVTVGIANSGGAGFKLLRLAN